MLPTWIVRRLRLHRNRRTGGGKNEPVHRGNLLAFWMLLRAHMLTFARERATLFWTIAFPLLFIVIFGAIFGGNQSPTFSVGVAGDSSSRAGQAIVAAFQKTEPFKLHQGDLSSQMQALRSGNRDAVVVLPSSIESETSGAGTAPAPVKIYYDSTITSNQQILLPIVDQVLSGVNQHLSGSRPMIVADPMALQTHHLDAIDFLLPGILAMALMQLGVFSSQALVAQRETRVLRRLAATPLPRPILVASQVVSRLLIAILQAVVLLLVAGLLFNFRISGSLSATAGFVGLGALAFVALGYVIAAVSPSSEAAGPIAQVVSFPMLFLSGVFFPVSLIPNFFQPVVRALPLTYLADALRQVSASGTPLNPLWVDGVVLCGWLVVCLLASVRFFRWE